MPDEKLSSTLEFLGIEASDLIAAGGEASVYRYGAERIVRISHEGASLAGVKARRDLLVELSEEQPQLPFEIPQVEEVLEPRGRVLSIEKWLPGETLVECLKSATGSRRERILVAALDASLQLKRLSFHRLGYCDLYWTPATTSPSWRGFLEARARRSLDLAGGEFLRVDAAALAAPFDDSPTKSFVHFDLYPGNLLVEGERVSALLDFSGMSLCGDARFDPLSLAVCLSAGISHETAKGDEALCRDWLQLHGLFELLEPADKLMAAIWSFAQDDPDVARWTRRSLLSLA